MGWRFQINQLSPARSFKMKAPSYLKPAYLLLACIWATPSFAAKQYSYFRVGNPNDISASTTPGTVLMGGGTDVDAAFQWMCHRRGCVQSLHSDPVPE